MTDSAANAVTVILPFVNGRYYVTMPSYGFLPKVSFKIWGAGGGAGGWESQPGGSGSGGAFVEGMFYPAPGDLIEVFVGGGGTGGTGGQGAAGGTNGKSYTGNSGGRGGLSGTLGSSGSGGGGGGATMIRLKSNLASLAGGGGGGGGAGLNGIPSNGSGSLLSPAYKSYSSAVDQGKGVAGQDHPSDGGGGGGGGGGAAGGNSGDASSGDIPGYPGMSGTNQYGSLNPMDTGLYATAADSAAHLNIDYPGLPIGQGGIAAFAARSGGNGYAILTFYSDSGVYVKRNGTFTGVRPSVKVNSEFHRDSKAWVKISNIWRPITLSSTISFLIDQTSWSDAGAERYIPPPPSPVYVSYYGGEGVSIGVGDVGVSAPGDCGDAGSCGGGGGGGGDCFIGSTLVLLDDGTPVRIDSIKIGDRVKNFDGTSTNTVTYIEYLTNTKVLYSPAGHEAAFATINHPIYVDGILGLPNLLEIRDLYPWLPITTCFDSFTTAPPANELVYNLWLTGDHTYQVNGYGTTSIIGDGGAVRQALEHGFITHQDSMNIIQALQDDGGWNLHYGYYLANYYLGKLNSKLVNKFIFTNLVNKTKLASVIQLGSVVLGAICGIFVRNRGHK